MSRPIKIGDTVYSAPWRGVVVGEGTIGRRCAVWVVRLIGSGRRDYFPKNCTELAEELQ